MGCGNVGNRICARGQQGRADIVNAGIALKETPRHLRLPGKATEIDDGTGVGQDFGAHTGGKIRTVGSDNGAVVIVRRAGVCVKSLGSTKSFRARVGWRVGNR